MSFQAVAWAINQVTGSSISKLVLIKLADAANDSDGRCWPSMKTLARQCEMSRDSIKRHIKKLEEKGLIRTEHRFANGIHVSNIYWIPFAGRGVGAESTQGVQRAPRVGAHSTQGVGAESTTNLSVLEPIKGTNNIKIPAELNNPEFLDEWPSYIEHRRRIKAPMTPHAQVLMLKKFAQRPTEAVSAIQRCMENGWRGFNWDWIDKQQPQQKRPYEIPF